MHGKSSPCTNSRRKTSLGLLSAIESQDEGKKEQTDSSIRNRIIQWQAQGVGVYVSDETKSSRINDDLHGEDWANRDVGRSGKLNGATLNVKDLEYSNREKEVPIKRVRSDGHWRANSGQSPRLSPKKEKTSRKQVSENEISAIYASDSEESRKEDAISDSPQIADLPRTKRDEYAYGSKRRRRQRQSSSAAVDQSAQDALHKPSVPKQDTCARGNPPQRVRRGASPSSRKEQAALEDHSQGKDCLGATPLLPSRSNILSQILGDSKKLFSKDTTESALPSKDMAIEAWLEATEDNLAEGIVNVEFKAKNNVKVDATRNPDIGTTIEDPGGAVSSDKTPLSRKRVDFDKRTRRSESRAKPSTTDNSLDQPHQERNKDFAQSRTPPVPRLQRRAARRCASSPVRDRRDASKARRSSGNQDLAQAPEESTKSAKEDFGLILDHTADIPPTSSQEEAALPSPFVKVSRRINSDRVHGLYGENPECQTDASEQNASADDDRTANHADLISVLSVSRPRSKRIKSARSMRSKRSQTYPGRIDQVMQEVTLEEMAYGNELQLLVDGVIPVLLSCGLSKSSISTEELLKPSQSFATHENDITKSIVEMGIALERLRTLHKRLSTKGHAGLLTWAHGAQRVYLEYIKAWRLGFQDVTINLKSNRTSNNASLVTDTSTLNIPRNDLGDLLDSDGERLDVAYLLRRPFARLKSLARTIRDINILKPSLESAELCLKYQSLVETVRLRMNEETARIEDDFAANIDVDGVRDLQTLDPIAGVQIDRSKRVKARDAFEISIATVSGQTMQCLGEAILRDDESEDRAKEDILICTMNELNRSLLFSPLKISQVLPRRGNSTTEIALEIITDIEVDRSTQATISMVAQDEQTCLDWLEMLGSGPLRPSSISSRPGSPLRNVRPASKHDKEPSDFVHKPKVQILEPQQPISPERIYQNLKQDDSHTVPQDTAPFLSRRELMESFGLSGTSQMSGIKRTRMKKPSKAKEKIAQERIETHSKRQTADGNGAEGLLGAHESLNALNESASKQTFMSDLNRSPLVTVSCGDFETQAPTGRSKLLPAFKTPFTMRHWRGTTGHPNTKQSNLDKQDDMGEASLNSIMTLRKKPDQSKGHAKETSEPICTQGEDELCEGAPRNASNGQLKEPLQTHNQTLQPLEASDLNSESDDTDSEEDDGSSMTSASSTEDVEGRDVATPLVPLELLRKSSPKLSAASHVISKPEGTLRPSDSASQAPYLSVPPQPAKSARMIASLFAWSESGAWKSIHPDECSIVVSPGLIEAFEMSAAHSADAVALSAIPGFTSPASMDRTGIDASNISTSSQRPLIAVELTPLVPLRRGTAIDISIRSPPIKSSTIAAGNNIMFRSRNPEECEGLYALINWARIHNPTYIALQNARGPFSTEIMPSRSALRGPNLRLRSGRLFSMGGLRRSSSYRAKRSGAVSVVASESSIKTMGTAFSALKRFSMNNSGGGGIMNLAGISRTGTDSGETSTCADSDNTSGNIPQFAHAMVPNNDGSLGLKDAKIRLYIRESASRWRDLGAARLSILPSEPENLASNGAHYAGARQDHNIHEKRILIVGKTKGETQLDAQLGENCFERVARTGIAVSVWEDDVGPNGELGMVNAVGGVVGGRAKVYMIQLKSEVEAAYTFSLVGKLRY